MNRRDFLRNAASATIGATGTIVIANSSAESLIKTGKTILTEDDIKVEGKIITQEDLLNEVVDMAKIGDNLADLLINSNGVVSFYPDHDMVKHGSMLWRIYGNVRRGSKFKQDGIYRLAHAGDRNMLNFGTHNPRPR